MHVNAHMISNNDSEPLSSSKDLLNGNIKTQTLHYNNILMGIKRNRTNK